MNFEPSGYFHTCKCMYTYMYIHPGPGTTSIPYTLYSMHPDIIDQLMLCKYFVIVHTSTSHSQHLGHPPCIHIHAHVHVRVNCVRTCVCVYPLSLRMACIVMYAVFLVSSVACTCMVYSTCAYMCMVYC